MERIESVEGRAAATLAAALFTGAVALALLGPSSFVRSVPPLIVVPLLSMGLVQRYGKGAAFLVGAALVGAVMFGGGSALVASMASVAAMGILLGAGARQRQRPRVTCLLGSFPVAGWLLIELYSGGAELVTRALNDQLGDVAVRVGDLLARLFPAMSAGGHEALVAAFPSLLFCWALVLAMGVYRLAELVLPHFGLRVPVTSSFSTFTLPWAVAWGVIGGLVLSIWGPGGSGAVGVNIVITCAMAYSLQGASVLSYWISKATGSAVRTIIVLGVWMLGAHLLAVVGFVDTWCDLRRMRGSRKSAL
jgi:hypothetical protein